MSGLIMFILIIGVIYVAFTYLKGPKNSDTYQNGFDMRPFNDGSFKGDTWNDEALPELPQNDMPAEVSPQSPAVTGVVVDSEVHIDAEMPSDNTK